MRISLILVMLVFASAARAQGLLPDYWFVTFAGEADRITAAVFMDASSIETSAAGVRRVRSLTYFAEEAPGLAGETEYLHAIQDYDCESGRVRTVSTMIRYRDPARPPLNEAGNQRWMTIDRNPSGDLINPGERQLTFVCSTPDDRAADEMFLDLHIHPKLAAEAMFQ